MLLSMCFVDCCSSSFFLYNDKNTARATHIEDAISMDWSLARWEKHAATYLYYMCGTTTYWLDHHQRTGWLWCANYDDHMTQYTQSKWAELEKKNMHARSIELLKMYSSVAIFANHRLLLLLFVDKWPMPRRDLHQVCTRNRNTFNKTNDLWLRIIWWSQRPFLKLFRIETAYLPLLVIVIAAFTALRTAITGHKIIIGRTTRFTTQ